MATPKNNRDLSVVATLVVIILAFPLISLSADSFQLPDGSNLDLAKKCPVCGMPIGGTDGQAVSVTFKDGHVAGFHGVAAAVFKDGHVVGFEGARCLFIYNSVPQKYNVNVGDIAHQYVTDYASKKMVELPMAYLVIGSEVKGPMGYELIPFTTKDAAAKFSSEHDGKWIVQLHEVAKVNEKESDRNGESETPGTLGITRKNGPMPPLRPDRIQQQDPSPERPAGLPILPPARQSVPPVSKGGGC